MTREICLTRDRVALVDDDDFDWLNQWKWRSQYGYNGVWYAVRETGPRTFRQTILMHRLILGVTGRNNRVDHKNHDGLDNRRENLRTSTPSQNNGNERKTTSKTSSRFKGVSWSKTAKKWHAYIMLNRKRETLGYFTSEDESAKAYNIAAQAAWGEYALLNIID